MTLLLTCPLCSQPGFQTLDSLRYGLISAATRQVICPVCHDILFGLDKFTIHLFSHTLQHHHEVERNALPIHLSDFNVNQQNNNAIFTQPKIIHLTVNPKQNDFPTTDGGNQETKSKSSTDDHQTRKNRKSVQSEQQRQTNNKDQFENSTKISSRINNKILKKQLIEEQAEEGENEKLSCKFECKKNLTHQIREISSHNIHIKSNNNSEHTQSESKYSSHFSALETPQISVTESVYASSIEDKPSLSSFNFGATDVHHQTLQNNVIQANSTQENFSVKNNVKCEICGFSFDDSSILAIHCQLVHPKIDIHTSKVTTSISKQGGTEEKRQFPCHLCSKAFKMRGSLMVHLRVAHSNGMNSVKSLLGKSDLESNTDERKFCCHLCSKSFKKEQHLMQHLKTHEGKQWECDICSKMFTTKYFLKKHKRLHTGETPYSCETCGKTFTFQQSYHKHLLYHSDDKPHVCSECDRAFKELSTLHNHQRIHTGEKPFACETCGKCFRQRVSYLVHRRIHTGVMPYQCTACGKNFRYKVSQRTHKCSSQPPGTVVKQTSELVQKLLQGVKEKTVSDKAPLMKVSSSTCNGSERNKMDQSNLKENQSFIVKNQSTELHQFVPYHGSYYGDASTMFLGKLSHMPTSLYKIPKSITKNELVENLRSQKKDFAVEGKRTTNNNNNNKNIKIFFEQKVPNLWHDAMEITDSKENDKGSEHSIEDNNNNRDKRSESQRISNSATSSSTITDSLSNCSQEKSGINNGNCLNERNKLIHNELISQSSVKVPVNSDPETKPRNLSEFGRSCNKLHKLHSDHNLTVDTTDFFTMVMSPTMSNLSSPSEKLQHLTLSSPVDTLVNYEDDGIYNFLLNPTNDNVQTQSSADVCYTNPNVNDPHLTQKENLDGESVSLKKEVSQNFNSPKSGVNSETLETINEESLKQILYGSSHS